MDPQFFRASILQLIPRLRAHVNFCEATLFETCRTTGRSRHRALGAQMRPSAARSTRLHRTQRTEACYIDNAPPLPA